jgi:DNA polymerase III epsilon subunit-like protein
MKLIFLDTETTGNDTKEDRLCQVCYKFEDDKDKKGIVIKKGEIVTKNFKPPVPISIKAMSVTNITNKMVSSEEVFKESQTAKKLQDILNNNILVAHNAKFDIAMLESEGVNVFQHICTLRLARYLDDEQEIPEYGLQFLRYYYEIELDNIIPHSAEGDVLVLEAVFQHLYEKAQEKARVKDRNTIIQRMIEISSQPSLIKKFPFGKYVGRRLEEIILEDKGYLEWLLKIKKEEGDEDWIYTLEYFLGKNKK